MQDLTILGASGTGLDIAEAVEDINTLAPRWRIRGFLDDNPALQGTSFGGYPVLGGLARAHDLPGEFVLAIASTKARGLRAELLARLEIEAERFATVLHPTVSLSPRSSVGPGGVILHHAVVGPNVVIGAHVLICAHATIGHDGRLGDHVVLAPAVGLSGAVEVGTAAYLGSGARVREKTRIGARALVGIGAVVLRDVGDNATVLGNPARQFI
jgi:sugar O-acyltransferase (sialic acid O-acetyltransferase NeuD family)